MTPDKIIAYAAVITLFLTVISWFVSSWITKRNMTRRIIKYRMHIDPIMMKDVLTDPDGLKIEYKGEELHEPLLLSVDIYNTGNTAISNPPIEITAPDATYVIPGYFEDVPAGYKTLWSITREDGETCKINLDHLNPGQLVKARFILDEKPSSMPIFSCPMPNVKVSRYEPVKISPILNALISITNPSLSNVIKISIGK